MVGGKMAVRALCVEFGGKDWVFVAIGVFLTSWTNQMIAPMDEIRIRRNRMMREEYREQYQKGFRHEIIVEKLIPKYALARMTIEAIVFQKGVYKDA